MAEAENTGLPEAAVSRRRWLVFALLALSYLLAFSQRTGPGMIADQLQAQFHVSSAVLGTMASIQYLLYMVLQVPVGMFGDRYGPERLFITGVCLDGVGTLVFSHSGSFSWLLVGRAIVGMGDALVWVNIVLILGKWFHAREFASTLGLVGTSGNVGALLATIPFAAWVSAAGWQSPFTVLGIALVAAAAANVFSITDLFTKRCQGRPAQVLRIERIPVWSVLRDVVRDRVAWATFCCHFGIMGAYIGFTSVWATPVFMTEYHLSRAAAAQFTLVGFVGALLGGPVIGYVSDRMGRRREPYIALQVACCAAWFSFVAFAGHTPAVVAYLAMCVAGFACGGSLLTFATIQDMTPSVRSGVTSGFANMGGFLSAVLLPVLFGAVMDALAGPSQSGPHASEARMIAFLVPSVFSVVGVIGSMMIPKRNVSV